MEQKDSQARLSPTTIIDAWVRGKGDKIANSFPVSALRVLALLLLLPLLMGQGYPDQTPLIGGAGGSPQRVTCPPGTFLSGVSARIGAFMEHIETWCAAARPDGLWAGQPFHGPMPGMGSSNGPPWQGVSCPRNAYVQYLSGVVYLDGVSSWQDYGDPFHTYVADADLSCYFPQTKSYYGIAVQTPPHYGADAPRYRDRNGFGCSGLATGLRGQSGDYVDSLGLTCAPFTALPRSDCVLCHSSAPWRRLRVSTANWALGVLLSGLAVALAAFTTSGFRRDATGQRRRFSRWSLAAIAVLSTATAFLVSRHLAGTIHFPWSPIAGALAAAAVGILGVGIATLLRRALAQN